MSIKKIVNFFISPNEFKDLKPWKKWAVGITSVLSAATLVGIIAAPFVWKGMVYILSSKKVSKSENSSVNDIATGAKGILIKKSASESSKSDSQLSSSSSDSEEDAKDGTAAKGLGSPKDKTKNESNLPNVEASAEKSKDTAGNASNPEEKAETQEEEIEIDSADAVAGSDKAKTVERTRVVQENQREIDLLEDQGFEILPYDAKRRLPAEPNTFYLMAVNGMIDIRYNKGSVGGKGAIALKTAGEVIEYLKRLDLID